MRLLKQGVWCSRSACGSLLWHGRTAADVAALFLKPGMRCERVAHLARRRSERRLERRTEAAPTRKRQLGMSIARSLPKYQFCVMFSVLTTSARLFGYTCNKARPRDVSHLSNTWSWFDYSQT